MDVYIYNADIYCEDCGLSIRKRIRKELKDAGDSSNPRSPDSNEWPQAIADGGGESDCPQHCASQGECINATAYGDDDRFRSGLFLENPLTSNGEAYVREIHESRPTSVSAMWMDHYGLAPDADSDDDSEDSKDSDESKAT